MTRCEVQASGAIELYFYEELGAAEREAVERHLSACAECTHALEELRVIRDALSSRPDVSAPASGDWSDFMARLDAAIISAESRASALVRRSAKRGGGYVAYVAMAALVALVTFSVALAVRSRHAQPTQTGASAADTVRLKADPTEKTADTARLKAGPAERTAYNPDTDFEALSEEHFERSKLVVLGLATKDPRERRAVDWQYERELASSLLDDTRMYRLAAEDRGLTDIAGVMRDLEIVLLQTSLTDGKDPSALPQIQRLIQKRDLLEKMNLVGTPAVDRLTGTKGI